MKEVVGKLILVFATMIALSFAFYYTLEPKPCQSFACFQEKMSACKPVQYVNEEPEASWKYEIVRKTSQGCNIEVTLLSAKEGDLRLQDFEGHSMLCTYQHGLVTYPDKDMSVCHGLLKEDLQGLIIEKLHDYLLANLLDVQEAFTLFNATSNQTTTL